MYAFPISSSHLLLHRPHHPSSSPIIKTINPTFFPTSLSSPTRPLFISKSNSDSSEFDLPLVIDADDDTNFESETTTADLEDEVYLRIEKIGKSSRRISSQIAIDADLETVWNLLTDYEKLADFIPGLATSKLLEKGDKYAKLFQIGEQNLGFGLKFNAKGVVDCYEKDLENTPIGQRRDIEFKMIEGDFQIFEGKWSIEETNNENEEFQTTLFYVVEVKPKVWLPIRLVEGRLCNEIKVNLVSIREVAQKSFYSKLTTC